MFTLSFLWLLLVWLLLCVVVGLAADATGRTGAAWFLAALVLTPFVPGFVMLLMPSREIKRLPKRHWPSRPHAPNLR